MATAGGEKRRGLRQTHRVNYKKLSDGVQLPKLTTQKTRTSVDEDQLYAVKIVDEDSMRYRVHYVGYSHAFDEWKQKEDVVNLEEDAGDDVEPHTEHPSRERFTLYRELATRIKASLSSNRKLSPVVKIDMPFDRIKFDGGLRLCGKEKRCVQGVQRFSITRFQDLNSLLGLNWHFRGINVNGDFCYVILNTVEYYLYHRRPLKEFMPSLTTEGYRAVLRDMGDMLVFTFVRGDGTSNRFGNDPQVFVN